jgi:hypothetical protein
VRPNLQLPCLYGVLHKVYVIVRHPRCLFWSSDDLSNNEIIMINNKLLKIFSILLLLSVAPAHASKIGIAATVQGVEISELKLQNAIDNYLRQPRN